MIALVWAVGDVGQIALSGYGGSGYRPGDEPLVGFSCSALIGIVTLCGLAAINFRAVKGVGQQVRLLTRARLIAWLCAIRLVGVIPVLFALRSMGELKDRIAQDTFTTLAFLALLDAAVAAIIAAGTVGALRRSTQPTPPPP